VSCGDAVAGCAGRNEPSTTNAAGDMDGGDDMLWQMVPGMQDTHPALVSGRGARVVVHSQDSMPHPRAEGYDVPAGFSVTIGVSARENVRLSQPHGNCTSDQRAPADTSRSRYRSVSVNFTLPNTCINHNLAEALSRISHSVFSGKRFSHIGISRSVSFL